MFVSGVSVEQALRLSLTRDGAKMKTGSRSRRKGYFLHGSGRHNRREGL